MWKFRNKKKENKGFSKLDYLGIAIVIFALLVCVCYLIYSEFIVKEFAN